MAPITVTPDFNAVTHILPPYFVATRLFGMGVVTLSTLTSDGKNIAQVIAEGNFRTCPWATVAAAWTGPVGGRYWGTPASPSPQVEMGIAIQDAIVAAGGYWSFKLNMGPPGVANKNPAAPPTPADPADHPGVYPRVASVTDDNNAAVFGSGIIPYSPEGWQTWANWAKARWGESKCAGAISDNEWENRVPGGYGPYWYFTGSFPYGGDEVAGTDWAFVNWRQYALAWNAVIPSKPLHGYTYSRSASSTPDVDWDFKSRQMRWLYGAAYATTPGMTDVTWKTFTYDWPHGSDGNDNYGATGHHSYGGDLHSATGAEAISVIVDTIKNQESYYTANMDWFQTIVPSSHKQSQEEWSNIWVDNLGSYNQVAWARTAFSDVCSFIMHARNQAAWNMEFHTFWGIGPQAMTYTGSADDTKYIRTDGGLLVRMPDYYAIQQMCGHFNINYPRIVSSTVTTDGRAVAAVEPSGNGCAVLIANLSTATQTLSVSGFTTITKITKLDPAGKTLDTPWSNIGTTIPATIAPLEALYIEGTFTPAGGGGGLVRLPGARISGTGVAGTRIPGTRIS